MIRRIAVVLLLSGISIPAIGQLRVGLHGGLASSKISEPEDLHPSARWMYKTGFMVGGTFDLKFTHQLLLVAQLNYSQKGLNVESPVFGTPPTVAEFTTNYIELPVYLRFAISDALFTWFLEAGPAVGYLVSATEEINHPQLGPVSISSTDRYKKLDVSIGVGVGGEVRASQYLTISLSVSYLHGLTPVYIDSSISKTRTFQFIVGVIHPLR